MKDANQIQGKKTPYPIDDLKDKSDNFNSKKGSAHNHRNIVHVQVSQRPTESHNQSLVVAALGSDLLDASSIRRIHVDTADTIIIALVVLDVDVTLVAPAAAP